MVASTMIEVEGIEKSFQSTKALAGVSLKVERATVMGLLGPNGAGKTTLVRILSTLLKPDQGRATVAGYDVVRDAVALRSVIGLAGQYAAVDELLTGREKIWNWWDGFIIWDAVNAGIGPSKSSSGFP